MHPAAPYPAAPGSPHPDAQACVDRGHLWHQAGDPAQAAHHYAQATQLDPAHSQAWFNLGVSLTLTGEVDLALHAYRQATATRPKFARAHNNLGILLQTRGQLADAERHYSLAAQADPRYPDPHYNAGLLAFAQTRFADAERAYRRALQLAPHHAEARNNLGHALLELGRPREARRCFEQVLAAVPEHPQARWNLGFTQLLSGDYASGWANHEWRLMQPGRPRPLAAPNWRGEALPGQSLLISSEQGLGDAIQFVRFLPAALALAAPATLYLEADPALSRLFAHLPAQLTAPGANLTPHRQISLLSLPAVLDTRLDTLPAPPPLAPSPSGRFRTLLDQALPAGHRRVGLAWSGNPLHARDLLRSIPAPLLPALTTSAPGISWVSVQRGTPPPGVVSFDEHLHDLADTAALITELDLVIAVDTVAAHLAGSLARPTWLLLPHAPDFRWLLDREDSPWYPTVRIFRQRRQNDWPHLLARVRQELLVQRL